MTTPVHATLRSRLSPLCTPETLVAIRKALGGSNRRDPARFRVVFFALRDDRVELVVEAKNERYLSEGMRSAAIRIARAVNDALGRKGSLWSDRWRGRTLTTREEVHAALVSMLPPFGEPPPSSAHGNGIAPLTAPRTALLRAASRAVDPVGVSEHPASFVRTLAVPRGASLAATTSSVLEEQIDVSHSGQDGYDKPARPAESTSSSQR